MGKGVGVGEKVGEGGSGERKIRGEEENWRMGRVMVGGEGVLGAKTIIRLCK